MMTEVLTQRAAPGQRTRQRPLQDLCARRTRRTRRDNCAAATEHNRLPHAERAGVHRQHTSRRGRKAKLESDAEQRCGLRQRGTREAGRGRGAAVDSCAPTRDNATRYRQSTRYNDLACRQAAADGICASSTCDRNKTGLAPGVVTAGAGSGSGSGSRRWWTISLARKSAQTRGQDAAARATGGRTTRTGPDALIQRLEAS